MPRGDKRRASSSSQESDVEMGGTEERYTGYYSKHNRPSIFVTNEDDIRRELDVVARAAANAGYSNLPISTGKAAQISSVDQSLTNVDLVNKLSDPSYHDRARLLIKAWQQLPTGVQSFLNAATVNFDMALQCLEPKRHAAIMRRAHIAIKEEEEAAKERQRQIERFNRMNMDDELLERRRGYGDSNPYGSRGAYYSSGSSRRRQGGAGRGGYY